MKILSLLLVLGLSLQVAMAAGGKSKNHQKAEMLKKELNLTDEQLAKVKEIRKNGKEALKASKAKFKESKAAFKAAMNDPKISNDELSRKFDEFQRNRDEFQRLRFNKLIEMRSVLNPDQIAKFREWRKKHKGQYKNKRKDKKENV